jgi:hypothetical protein
MLILDPGVWNKDGAWFAIFIKQGNKFEQVNITEWYSGKLIIEISNSITQIYFGRMQPNTTGNVWNRTNEITLDNINNCYKITGWNGGDFTKSNITL